MSGLIRTGERISETSVNIIINISSIPMKMARTQFILYMIFDYLHVFYTKESYSETSATRTTRIFCFTAEMRREREN